MFKNWFKRSKDSENTEQKAAENAGLTAKAVQPSEMQNTEADSLTEKPEKEEDAEEASSEAEPSGSEEKAGGLRGLWEGARKLAMTPVDPWFNKMAQGLDKTRRQFVDKMGRLFSSSNKIDEEFWEELEDIMLTGDVGLAAATRIIDDLKTVQKEKKITVPADLLAEVKNVMGSILKPKEGAEKLNIDPSRLNVIMMVGVNGVGKTTTAAKLAAKYKNDGYKVMLAAADTFRAAAIDQLQVWADRAGVDIVRRPEGSDPSAVVFDAIKAAEARGCNLVIVDTAGRLHNKANLMDELGKIKRVANKAYEGAPHETLLVLDATTGQNAMEQAKIFNQATELSGLVMCKLDGTGKGGVVIAIGQELNVPVRFIGVGEAVDDLREFDGGQFLKALFSDPGSIKDLEEKAESDSTEQAGNTENGK